MPDLRAVCAVCDDEVDANTVEAHMDAHGLLLPNDWQLKSWPDGTAFLLGDDTDLEEHDE